MVEQTTLSETVQLKDTGVIKLPTFDGSKYVGVDTVIVQYMEYRRKWGEKDSYYVKLISDVIDTWNGNEIRATKILGLQVDANGKVGWGSETKMDMYLKKKNVQHYKDLIGIVVKVQTDTGSDGRDYLTFN